VTNQIAKPTLVQEQGQRVNGDFFLSYGVSILCLWYTSSYGFSSNFSRNRLIEDTGVRGVEEASQPLQGA